MAKKKKSNPTGSTGKGTFIGILVALVSGLAGVFLIIGAVAFSSGQQETANQAPTATVRGTLPSQKPSQTPEQTQAPKESNAPEETIQPTAEPTQEATPEPTQTSAPTQSQGENPSGGGTSGGGNGNNFQTWDNPSQQQTPDDWVLNTSSKKIHYPSCSSVASIAPQNYATSNASLNELLTQGYTKCGRCF